MSYLIDHLFPYDPAWAKVACPKCGQPKGKRCRSLDARTDDTYLLSHVHVSRVDAGKAALIKRKHRNGRRKA